MDEFFPAKLRNFLVVKAFKGLSLGCWSQNKETMLTHCRRISSINSLHYCQGQQAPVGNTAVPLALVLSGVENNRGLIACIWSESKDIILWEINILSLSRCSVWKNSGDQLV